MELNKIKIKLNKNVLTVVYIQQNWKIPKYIRDMYRYNVYKQVHNIEKKH